MIFFLLELNFKINLSKFSVVAVNAAWKVCIAGEAFYSDMGTEVPRSQKDLRAQN